MKHKTAELEGALLDAAVAKARGWESQELDGSDYWWSAELREHWWRNDPGNSNGKVAWFRPSTDWAVGGPIIERERIGLWAGESPYHGTPAPAGWFAEAGNRMQFKGEGPTPLIAAMRAFVASKLGTEADL